MNFYLDFEATQYSSRIISIGCVDDLGNTFKTLVGLKKRDSVGKYITQLTGITEDDLLDAPSADQAFNLFYRWVCEHSDGGTPKYFCYGNADAGFIKNTINIMSDFQAITFAASICTLMEDYSLFVSDYLQSQPIALRKVVALVRNSDDVVQSHDALEDAEMLRFVVNKLQTSIPKVPSQLSLLPVISKSSINKEQQSTQELTSTLGDPVHYKIKGWTKTDVYYFKSFREAALWVLWPQISGGSDTVSENTINRVMRRICNAADNCTKYNLLKWERKVKQVNK